MGSRKAPYNYYSPVLALATEYAVELTMMIDRLFSIQDGSILYGIRSVSVMAFLAPLFVNDLPTSDSRCVGCLFGGNERMFLKVIRMCLNIFIRDFLYYLVYNCFNFARLMEGHIDAFVYKEHIHGDKKTFV